MEFTVNCPIDGAVDVGLEDIDTVVLREAERADITFVCPHCGSPISVSAIVPAFLLSAIEALADDTGEGVHSGFVVVGTASEERQESSDPLERDLHEEAYCEYFRRQLDSVDCAEDALAEIDSGRSSV